MLKKNTTPQIVKQQGYLKNSENDICMQFMSNPLPFLLSLTNFFTFLHYFQSCSLIFSFLFSLLLSLSSSTDCPYPPFSNFNFFSRLKEYGSLLQNTLILWVNEIEMPTGYFEKHTWFEFKNHHKEDFIFYDAFLCFFFSCLLFFQFQQQISQILQDLKY